MKRMYIEISPAEYWSNYWKDIQSDPEMRDDFSYPVFPLNQYIKKSDKILEAGCGLGRVIKYFKNRVSSIVGIDIDWFCLDTLRKEGDHLLLLKADCKNLPFKDKSFDAVLSFGTYSTVENGLNTLLRESKRILKDNGILCMSVACASLVNQLSFSNIGFKIRSNGLLRKIFRKKQIKREKYFFGNMFELKEIREIIQKEGLNILKICPVLPEHGFWHLFPFFRKEKWKSIKDLRSSDSAYEFNNLGKSFFYFVRRYFPYAFASGIYCITKKLNTDLENIQGTN